MSVRTTFKIIVIFAAISLFIYAIQFTRLPQTSDMKKQRLRGEQSLGQSGRTLGQRKFTPSKARMTTRITTTRPTKPSPTTPPGSSCRNSVHEVKTFVKKSKSGIPLIIHQVYKDTNLPQQYIPLLQGCRRVNKEFLHILWTDADFGKFLKTRPANIRSQFSTYRSVDRISDVMRLVILEHFGGVYMDLDVECLKPLVATLDALNKTCIIGREQELQTRLLYTRLVNAMNSVMIATPGHKFLRYLLGKLPEQLHEVHTYWKTGNFYVTECYMEYNRTKRSPSDAVYIAPAHHFTPLVDPAHIQTFNKKCGGNDWKKEIQMHQAACEEWHREAKKRNEAKDTGNATLVHRYLSLIYPHKSKEIRKRVDACLEVESVSRYIL